MSDQGNDGSSAMSPKNREEELAKLSYLWTSGDWKLHQTNHSCFRIVFVFKGNRPSLKELSAVRALVPRFAALPIIRLKEEIGNLAEFLVGEYSGIEARRLQSEAATWGMRVRCEDSSYTSYLLVSAEGHALVIEDDELAQLIAVQMKRHGIPIGYAESD